MLSGQGITTILSSHILSEVGQIADRIGIINKGLYAMKDKIPIRLSWKIYLWKLLGKM